MRPFVRIRVAEHNNLWLNQTAIESILATGLSVENLPTYVNLIGYSSVENYVQTQNLCKEYESELVQEYGVEAINSDIFAEAIDRMNPPIIYPPMGMKSSYCETVYRTTINSIVASVTVMQTSCVALDLVMPIVGAICHTAAAGWAINQIELADANYAICK